MSTALSLSHRYPTHNITLLEASTTIPNPEGSSVDSSRIVRADYANAAYARLAAEGLERWRNTEWGAEGRYTQNGLVLVYHKSSGDAGQGDDGERYTRASYENVKRLANGDEKIVRFLPDRNAIHGVFPRNTVHVAETVVAGYVNWGSGWADAEAGVRYARKKLEELGVVKIRTDQKVSRLLFSDEKDDKKKVAGVQLADGSTITADLVILATGAWTPGLLDLRGLADARGQVLAYLRLTDEEQARLANMPTLLSFSTGMFIIPPRNNELKIARHAYGYRNPTRVRLDSSADVAEEAEVSLPETGRPIPPEGEEACRAALREMLPWLADRPFFKTRVCWYTDTYGLTSRDEGKDLLTTATVHKEISSSPTIQTIQISSWQRVAVGMLTSSSPCSAIKLSMRSRGSLMRIYDGCGAGRRSGHQRHPLSPRMAVDLDERT